MHLQQDSSYRNRELHLAQELCANADDVIDFYNRCPPLYVWYNRITSHGPLAWVSIVMKDPFLRPIHDRVIGKWKPTSQIPYVFSKANAIHPTASDAQFSKKVLDYTGISDNKPLTSEPDETCIDQKDESDAKDGCRQVKYDGKWDLREHNCNYHTFEVIHKMIIEYLPTRKTIALLMDRYFAFVAPFQPFLDETEFRRDIEMLFGPRSMTEDRISRINFKTRLDLATAGSLLLVLVMAHMSLHANYSKAKDFPARTPDEQYLIKHPISQKLAKVALLCIDQFNLMSRTAFNLIQFLLLVRERQCMKGAESFSDGTQQIFLGLLVQLGISIGLDRDSSRSEDMAHKERLQALMRKIWYSMEASSTFQSVIMGSPRLITTDMFDTKIPTFNADFANICDLSIEKETIDGISSHYRLGLLINDILTSALNMHCPPRVGEILCKLDTLETYIRDKWGNLANILTPTDGDHCNNLRKVMEIYCYLEASSLIHPVYYHLFLLYESKHNFKACFLICKVILRYAVELISQLIPLMKYSYRYIGVGFDSVLMPIIATAIQKFLQMQISIYTRMNTEKKRLQRENNPAKNATRAAIYDSFMESMMQVNFHHCYIQGLMPVASYSFYVWMLIRAPSFIFKLLRTDDVEYPKVPYNFLQDLTDDQILELKHVADPTCYQANPKMGTAMSNSSDSQSHEMSATEIDKFCSEIMQQNVQPPQPTGGMNSRLSWPYGDLFTLTPFEAASIDVMGQSDDKLFEGFGNSWKL